MTDFDPVEHELAINSARMTMFLTPPSCDHCTPWNVLATDADGEPMMRAVEVAHEAHCPIPLDLEHGPAAEYSVSPDGTVRRLDN